MRCQSAQHTVGFIVGTQKNGSGVLFPLIDGELHLHTDKLGLQPDSLYVHSS